MEYHIYIGNVLPVHKADQIVSVIHTHANIEKEQIDIADLSKNQSHPRTKAFKVSVPKGKLHTVTQLPWDSAIKVQPFRQKKKGTTAGTNRKQQFTQQTRRPQYNPSPGRFNGRPSYWEGKSADWRDWGYHYYY